MHSNTSVKTRLVAAILLFPWTIAILIACGGGGGEGGEEPPAPPVATDCPGGFIEAPSRGVACLHCNHRNAQAQADILTSIMTEACIRNVSWNTLVSGTFGYDEAFMVHQIEKLSANRHLSLTLFVLNGPGQRRHKSQVFDGFGEKMSPEDFRKRIQWDEAFRDQYRNHVAKFGHLIDLAVAQGVTVNVIPQLEDNMTDAAFSALLKLTQEVLVGKPVRYGRNPCPSCYPGSQGWIPPGVFEEEHTDKPFFNVSNGIVTNDGDDVGGDYDSLKSVRNRAGERGNEFIVWTAKFQGIGQDGKLVDPDTRNYSVPSPLEISEIKELIRGE